jgi:hypothetical protein
MIYKAMPMMSMHGPRQQIKYQRQKTEETHAACNANVTMKTILYTYLHTHTHLFNIAVFDIIRFDDTESDRLTASCSSELCYPRLHVMPTRTRTNSAGQQRPGPKPFATCL